MAALSENSPLYIARYTFESCLPNLSSHQAAFIFIFRIILNGCKEMITFNANYWEDHNIYIANKKRDAVRIEKKIKSKKESQNRLRDRDATIKGLSKHYSEEMRVNPSELEKRMIDFLNTHNIQYEFQKAFLIKNKNKNIDRFYIADFYIPSKNLIIETDGAFHDRQVKEDYLRTKDIQAHYPNVKVIRWRWHDFESYTKMKDLLKRLD